jgi:hypothetical protein
MILLSQPALTNITYDLELGLILADFRRPVVPDCSAVVQLTADRRAQLEARFHFDGDDWRLEPVRAVELDSAGDVMGEIDLEWTVEWLATDGRWAEIETALLANRLRRMES